VPIVVPVVSSVSPVSTAPREIIIRPSRSLPTPPTVQPVPIHQLPARATQPAQRNAAIVPIPAPPTVPPTASPVRTMQPLPVPRSAIPIGYTGDRRSPTFTSPSATPPSPVPNNPVLPPIFSPPQP
jgi:hypothetical protein